MIFVTLGTQDKSFHRLLEMIDKMIDLGIINDEIIVQAGSTKYESNYMQIFDFIDMDAFSKFVADCDLMITHAGVGTIINGINHGKKIMAVARREKYGEHENDHQVEITTKFSHMGYIVGCLDVNEMIDKFAELKTLKVKPYISNNEAFCALIEKFINE
ncbi:MAG: hypothetical protein KH431_04775 [Erysipelotrichaceae bacterium]|nr:hypothetical protein [Erysipelotrichaceae bacterium]